MNKLFFSILKFFYLLVSKKTHQKFMNQIENYQEAQIQVLKKIYRMKKFSNNNEVLRYHQQQKNITYEQLGSAYHNAKKGSPHPVTGEKIKVIEPTSGSSGRKKRILYTSSLLRIFQKMFVIWSTDLLLNIRNLQTGLTYISISPRFSKEDDEGLDSDKEYLDNLTSFLMSPFILCPSRVGKIKNSEDFYLVTALYFICEEDLEIISIWSPSFLGSIIKCLIGQHQRILEVIETEKFTTQCGQEYSFRIKSEKRLEALKSKQISLLFEQVKLISCWMSSTSRSDVLFLKDYFPQAIFQPKGLLATEAPLTIPLTKENLQIPLYDEVFYEFEDEQGQLFYLWQLEVGKNYEIIFSHTGGLIRYRLNDLITVPKLHKGLPVLDFISRAGAHSDLVGEKLSEVFLSSLADELKLDYDWIVIPEKDITHEKGYTLFYDKNAPRDKVELLVSKIESSYHFQHALKLKQLRPTKTFAVEQLKSQVAKFYELKGIKMGDLKFQHLIYKAQDSALLDYLKT